MNRRLDGRWLTTADMTTIAIDAGLATAEEINNHLGVLHNETMGKSWLTSLTANERLRLFSRGLLNLDTRTPANTPGYVEPT